MHIQAPQVESKPSGVLFTGLFADDAADAQRIEADVSRVEGGGKDDQVEAEMAPGLQCSLRREPEEDDGQISCVTHTFSSSGMQALASASECVSKGQSWCDIGKERQ